MAKRRFNALPGFDLTMGFTLFYLSAIVLIPIAGLFLRALEISWQDFWRLATTERALAAYKLTFGASLVAALANAAFGTILAWVLVRYSFPLKQVFDALVDLPFALPTAVAGLVYSGLYAENGWLGQFLVPLGMSAPMPCRWPGRLACGSLGRPTLATLKQCTALAPRRSMPVPARPA